MFERFFWDNDGTLTDGTISWSNPHNLSSVWDAKSYLYVSSFLPFNHKYFDIKTANDKNGTLTIEVYYNDTWVSVADIIDYTSNGTRSFSQSGNILFIPDEDYGWKLVGDSSEVTELATTKIYDAFWMRFGFNAAEASALDINYIGHKFCDDTLLYTYYPILNNSGLLTRFSAGKTNWISQEINASNIIIADLRRRGFVSTGDQVLDLKRYEVPCVHKTAELIFSALGSAYSENMADARKYYESIMNSDQFGVDKNQDGFLSRLEKRSSIKLLDR